MSGRSSKLTMSPLLASDTVVSGFTFGFYLYFIIDYFIRFASRIPGYSSIRPTLLAVIILSGLLFVQRDKFRGRFDDPVFRAFMVLVGYIIISLPLVEWPGSVLRENWETFLKAVVFLFFTALIVDTESRLKWFVTVFVSCQIFRVLEPLFLNITQGYWGSETHLGGGEFANRLAGAPADIINPNELGFVIATAIPFLHYLLWPRGFPSKILYMALLPAMLYALILTMSRGGFLALLVVAFLVFKESRKKMGLVALGAVVVVAALAVMNPVQKDRYLSLVDSDTAGGATAEGRISGMIGEFKLGFKRPVVGHGLGTTAEAKYHHWGSTKASHNLYGEAFVELGMIGLILFLRFLYQTGLKLFQVRRKFSLAGFEESSYYARLNKTLIAIFWMYIVYSLNYWGLSQYYWYLFAGLVIAFGRIVDKEIDLRGGNEDGNNRGLTPKYPLAELVRG